MDPCERNIPILEEKACPWLVVLRDDRKHLSLPLRIHARTPKYQLSKNQGESIHPLHGSTYWDRIQLNPLLYMTRVWKSKGGWFQFLDSYSIWKMKVPHGLLISDKMKNISYFNLGLPHGHQRISHAMGKELQTHFNRTITGISYMRYRLLPRKEGRT
jgi:hypothetical protein